MRTNIGLFTLFVLLAAFGLIWGYGCTVAPVPTAAPAVVPVVEQPAAKPQAYKADWPKAEWTAMLAQAIRDHGPALVAGYYPGSCGDKVQFYTMLLSSLARYESSFNPKATYQEKFPDAKGNRVISRGLYQVSIESANGSRYKCGIKKAEDLHDPKTNIICAVKIANALIAENGVIYGSKPWAGMARYWSPFRDAAKTKAIMAKARGTCE